MDDSTWVRPIHFQEETKEWLKDRQPWPDHLVEDLQKIYRHNRKVKEIYGK